MKEIARRKLRLLAYVITIGFVLIGGGCSSTQNAYEDGIRKAQQELNLGIPCIYTTSMADVRKYDETTGLPYLVLESPITPELLKMIEGHNVTMYAKYGQQERLPATK